jgi:dTDP-4-amino-4,6-dideoxygalactose transaminase
VNWKIPYFRHDLGQVELDSLAGVLKGDILTTGEAVSAFEAKFASYLGQRHALAVTSCTGALHMALLALEIGPGDEVITTPMSFVATATAILEAGATPVFVEVEADTGNLDPHRVEAAIT